MKIIIPLLLGLSLIISLLFIKIQKDDKDEMLKSFLSLEVSLNNSNEHLTNYSMASLWRICDEAKSRPEEVGPYCERARQVKEVCNNFVKYIEILKRNLIANAEDQIVIETEEILQMNRLNEHNFKISSNYFDKKKTKELLDKMDSTGILLLNLFNDGEGVKLDPTMRAKILLRSYLLIPSNLKKYRNEFEMNLKKSSLGEIIIMLTRIQNEIRNFESDIIVVFQRTYDKCFTFIRIEAKVIPNARMVKVGTEYKAEVFLVASNYKFDNPVIVNGQVLPIKNGKGIYSITPKAPGVHFLEGVIQVRGPAGIKEYPFKEKFEAY